LGRMFMGIGGGVIALPASSMLGISLGPLELVILGLLVSILGVFLSYNADKSNPASSHATARNF